MLHARNRHHSKCILKSGLITEIGLLKGFEGLRWDDQQSVKKALGFESEGGAAGGGGKKGAKAAAAEQHDDIANVKYSGGEKTCTHCSTAFKRGDARAVMMGEKEGETYHIAEECLVSALPKHVTTALLVGFEKLKEEDRNELKAIVDKVNPNAGAPAVTESAEAKAAREMSEKLWKAKDDIRGKYNGWQLKAILKHNDQSWMGLGPTELVDRVAEGIVNGALPKCTECNSNALAPHSGQMIKCHGNISAWSRCTFEAKNADIKRAKWKNPAATTLDKLVEVVKEEQADKKNAFLGGPTTDAATPAADAFRGLVFVTLGTWKGEDEDIAKIEQGGGSVSSTFTAKVTHVLATYDEVSTTPKRAVAKRTKALASTLPILDPRVISYCAANKKTLKILDNLSDFVVYSSGSAQKPDDSKVVTVEKKKKRKRLVVPPIDKDFDERENYQIYVANNSVYAITLNMTDLSAGDRGKNSLYVMQALQHKTKKNRYAFFTKWGRIGMDLNWRVDDEFTSPGPMVHQFEEKFYKMTQNHFESYMNNEFEKKPKGYYPVDLDADDEDEEEEEENEKTAAAVKERKKRVEALVAATDKPKAERLCPRVASLISLMFNKESITKQMQEMEIDTKKMPLGQLSKRSLKEGAELLEKIETLIKEAGFSNAKLEDLCNRFYTKVPHDFGMARPPLIDTPEKLQKKFDLIDTLMDIEVAARMMESETPAEEDPLMKKYQELGNKIEALDKSSDEYKRLEAYATLTQGHTKLKVLDIYRVNRNGESDSFAKHNHLDNRKLLFHGSSVAVFPAILSGGIKIMPHSGGRVGRGNYSADMIDKSQGYCGKAGKIGLILLNEVALGNIKRIYADDSRLVAAPPGFNSVLACGRLQPDDKFDHTDISLSPSGHPVIIPQAKGITMKDACAKNTSFHHNEYLVYDATQVHMRYLLHLEWPF